MDEIWRLKDESKFWSIQQQRGSAVGRHACLALTREDGENLLQIFNEINPNILPKKLIKCKRHGKKKLPIELKMKNNELNYEGALQSLMVQAFKAGKYKNV